MFPLSRVLKTLIGVGTLHIVDAAGRTHSFSGAPGREVTIKFHDRWVPWTLALNPQLAMGEVYMDGRVTIENGDDIRDFLDLVMENMGWERRNIFNGRHAHRMKQWIGRLFQLNPIGRSRQNVHHHYDLSGALYDLFLDRDRQYSCGYFPDGVSDLDTAQAAKKAHLAAKLLLKDGQKILDIGCGWGGLALYLNRVSGAMVTGVTLSTEQYALAEERARAAGVENAVKFRLEDYRNVSGKFDRVVSVGMFEHVGAPQYRTFFKKLHDVLEDDGVALLHSIGRADGPGRTNAWIRKYIFPGGYSPALSEIVPVAEEAGFYITDIEILRLHYAKTLAHWYDRVQKNRGKIIDLYDERFVRMWEFYLAASQKTFEYSGHVVFQIQLAKRQSAVPLTRDYITDWERAHGIEDPALAPAQRQASMAAKGAH